MSRPRGAGVSLPVAAPCAGGGNIASAIAAAAAAAGNDGWAPEVPVAEWMAAQSAAEVERLRDLGQAVLLLRAKNVGVVIENVPEPDRMAGKMRRDVANRAELDTAFDFDRVAQLMVSDPVPCPVKPGYLFVHVVLAVSSRASPPLLLGYLYDGAIQGNDLRSWLLVNKAGRSSRHRVDEFAEVG